MDLHSGNFYINWLKNWQIIIINLHSSFL